LSTILITGAAGRIGTLLRQALADDYTVRCHDTVAPERRLAGEEWFQGDVTDAASLAAAAEGVRSIVHLAADGNPAASWEDLHRPNILGVQAVYATAVGAGVRSVVFASSHHASGGHDRDATPGVDATWAPRPCCRYGVSKIHGEALGRYHADVDGLAVTCLRIGYLSERPTDALSLRIWVSPADLVRAFRAALATGRRYGVHLISSANSRSLWNTAQSNRLLGYAPVDDAETYASLVDADRPLAPCFRPAADPTAGREAAR
jgi:NAD(P)-dependent dehydrogenase (short-subunit alcohol dehydrogenase family)